MMTFLLNPKVWVAALAAAMLFFIVYTFQENDKLKGDIKAQQQTIEQLQEDAKILKAGQEVVVNDIKRLDDIANYKQTIVIKEQALQNDLNAIPETEDRPFSDPNNLRYAERLRAYQHEFNGTVTPNQPD